jgi:hypothetical protein
MLHRSLGREVDEGRGLIVEGREEDCRGEEGGF